MSNNIYIDEAKDVENDDYKYAKPYQIIGKARSKYMPHQSTREMARRKSAK